MILVILNKIETMPTIMSVEQETSIIEEVMSISLNEIIQNKNVFISILDALQTSHMDVIYEITKENYLIFKQFSYWLISLTGRLNDERLLTWLNSTSDTMQTKLF